MLVVVTRVFLGIREVNRLPTERVKFPQDRSPSIDRVIWGYKGSGCGVGLQGTQERGIVWLY